MAANETGSSQYQWSQGDLQDLSLWRVNSTLTSINSRLSTLESSVTSLQKSISNITPEGATANGGIATSIVTVHADRNSFAASAYSVGSFLTETDRNSVYQVRLVLNRNTWVFLTGVMRGTSISPDLRPTDLSSNDTGFIFYSTDALLVYRWSGSAWVVQDDYQPLLIGTHSQRLSAFPSTRYTAGQEYYESDRLATYYVQNASGTVTVTGGTNVAWVSGNHFVNTGTGFDPAQWVGSTINIGGVACKVAAVVSPTSLTLTAATTNAAGVNYSVPSGRWVYLFGQYADKLANIPADLGENDAVSNSGGVASGFLFFENNVYFHQVQWTGSAWQRGPGDRDRADTFMDFGAAPSEGGWHICDGTNQNFFNYANPSAPGTRTLPALSTSAAYPKHGAAYSPAITAAQDPIFTGTPQTGINVLNTGGSTDVVAATYTPGGTIAMPNGDPIANYSPLRYYRQ